jgi:glycosyltransferase involved in cell wall biosynthesis
METTLFILTPLLPGRLAQFAETRKSVAAALAAARRVGWQAEWIVSVDGVIDSTILHDEARVVMDANGVTRRGVSVARNRGLVLTNGEGWVLPLDDDDQIDADGLVGLLSDSRLADVEWASTNRVLLDGAATIHWRETVREWPVGSLEENWTSPFPFHPNSLLIRSSLALAVGGWPAVPANEDLAFTLAISGLAAGISLPHIVTRYRVWPGQAVSQPGYRASKEQTFEVIARMVNARRTRAGLPPIVPPPVTGEVGTSTVTRFKT